MGNSASHLRPEIIADISDSTDFSANEIREWYYSFTRDCSPGRMTISKEEFIALYGEMFPKGDATKFAEQVFRVFDTDKGGRLNFREFVTALSVMQKGDLDQRLKWAFALYDIRGTGTLTKDELLEITDALYIMLGKEKMRSVEGHQTVEQVVDHIFHRAAKTHADELDLAEFVEGAKSSRTLNRLFKDTSNAISSPFLKRKRASSIKK